MLSKDFSIKVQVVTSSF